MNVLEIIQANLKSIGADGLCNTDDECGCGIDDLAPCMDGFQRDCRPAKLRVATEPGENHEIGDKVFFLMDAP